MIPAELLFWYELALKMALTAAIVVGASVAVERSGPFIGALIATLPSASRPPALMVALHIWALSHGIASLFGRGDAARRTLPISAEELLEAGTLVYLRGLGLTGTGARAT